MYGVAPCATCSGSRWARNALLRALARARSDDGGTLVSPLVAPLGDREAAPGLSWPPAGRESRD